jgi:hypothetical protein
LPKKKTFASRIVFRVVPNVTENVWDAVERVPARLKSEAENHRQAAGASRGSDPRRAVLGLRWRAGFTASNRVWDSNPLSLPWSVNNRWWLLSVFFESALPQNHFGELPSRLLV